MKISDHALTRAKQRGIPLDFIPIIVTYGTPSPKPGKATEYQLLDRDIKWLIQSLDKLAGKSVIVSDDDVVLTSYAVPRKRQRHNK